MVIFIAKPWLIQYEGNLYFRAVCILYYEEDIKANVYFIAVCIIDSEGNVYKSIPPFLPFSWLYM